MWPVETCTDLRRQEHDVAAGDGISGAAVLQLSLADNANQHPRRAHRADCERRLPAVPPYREMFTTKESLSPYRQNFLLHRRHRTDCDLLEIDAGNRLLNLQRSMLACPGVDAIPVVQTKRDIAVFLHLEHHKAAERVNGPSSEEDGVADLRP